MFKVRLSEELVDKIVADYVSGCTASETARKNEVSTTVVRKYLSRRGVPRHTTEYVMRRSNGCVLNDSAFDEFNEEAAYWAGFLAADGCIQGTTVSLRLKSTDIAHVEKFRSFVGGNQKIHIFSREHERYKQPIRSVDYVFCSKKITTRLAEFGITARKSLTFRASELAAENKYFMRGALDGDGCLHITKKRMRGTREESEHPYLSLVGAKDFCEQFAAYAVGIIGKGPKVRTKGRIYVVSLYCTPAYKLIKHFYEDANVYLDRKKELADKIIRDFAYKYA